MYTPKTQPFFHQTTALERAGRRDGFAYLMEMGTGKTKVLIDEAGELHTDQMVDVLVVLCPKTVMSTWRREVETHLGVPSEVTMWTSSPNRAQRDKMEKVVQGKFEGLAVVVINIESLSSGSKARDFLRTILENFRVYLAVDESQTIKNASSKRTKNLLSVGRLATYRRIATGSPSPNSPMDLYSQLEFIVPGCTRQRSFFGFRARYAVLQKKNFGGRSVQVEVGYRNLDELREIVSANSYRVRKDECLDLPDKIYTQRSVELTAEQQRVYSQMRNEALAVVGGSFSSSQAAITTLIRLQQIVCGYFRDDNGDLVHLDSNRVNAVMEIAEQTNEDIVIWVGQHTPIIPRLANLLKENFGEQSVAMFYGGNASTRDEDANRFVHFENCRFMLSTQAAGARGNTWVNATQHIYYANTYNLEERLQSEDRSHRSGQLRHVTYTDLVAEGTVDERLRQALVRKENMSATLIGEAAREWM